MRNLSFNGFKWDKSFIIGFIITLICAIISGIVLFKIVNINIYFKNYAFDYVYYVFNFKNTKLIFSHVLSELFFLYVVFLIAYFTKFKYLTLIIIYVRGLYITVYSAILVGLNSFGGITVAILVFIPISLISLLFCLFIAELSKIAGKNCGKYVFAAPAVLALINTIILLILVNVVFRVIIVIV